jgi:hypothetical protein
MAAKRHTPSAKERTVKVDFDPCSNRWFICLPDEPGRPRIEADSPEVLEHLLNNYCCGQCYSTKTEGVGAA